MTTNHTLMNALAKTLQVMLAVLLIFSGVSKWMEHYYDLYAIGSLSTNVDMIKRLLASFEIVLGIALIAMPASLPVLMLSAGLFWCFFTYAVVKVSFLSTGSASGSCGCFGAFKTPFDSGWPMVGRNLALGAASLVPLLIVVRGGKPRPDLAAR